MPTPPADVRQALAEAWVRCAHHEAGHALAARAAGLPVVRAVLGYQRRSRWFGPDEWSVTGRVDVDLAGATCEQIALIALAGPAAEAQWLHRVERWPLHTAWTWAYDRNPRDAREARETGVPLHRLTQQALDVAGDQWRRLARVAAELAQRQQLSGRRTHALAR